MPKGHAARPEWLTLGAVKVWKEYEPVLSPLGLLTDMDGEVFGHWCELAAEFRESPRDMSANRIARMDALSQRFGMDPSSRSRINLTPKESGNDEERFFGAG
jgi:phage terminase small subunit